MIADLWRPVKWSVREASTCKPYKGVRLPTIARVEVTVQRFAPVVKSSWGLVGMEKRKKIIDSWHGLHQSVRPTTVLSYIHICRAIR